jgi:NAD(P)-dependent dehydrogenase (short-subunit alcohol dehydrogenase family)
MTTLTASSVLKEGNTAVITGASSGIGRAAAWDFVSKGMHVWMVDNDKEELEAALELSRQKKKSDGQVRILLQNVLVLVLRLILVKCVNLHVSNVRLDSLCLSWPYCIEN